MEPEGGKRFYLIVGFLWLLAALGVFSVNVAGRWMALACLVLAIIYFAIALMSNRPVE
jgi:hypothetical protein